MSLKIKYIELMKEHDELRALEAQVAAKKSHVEQLKIAFMRAMDDVGTSTYNADLGVVSVVEREVPNVVDWQKLYDTIIKDRAFDLLQRRVSSTAWRARLEAGDTVPGVETAVVRSLSVR
jgi:hypothetical protein